jgi:hypothetical protein
MRREEAIEKCRVALMQKMGYLPSTDVPRAKDMAEEVVVCLEALGLLKLEK